jgi:hypothetical protein
VRFECEVSSKEREYMEERGVSKEGPITHINELLHQIKTYTYAHVGRGT